MSNVHHQRWLQRPLRVLFFGSRCRLSTRPLQALLEAGVHVAAIVIPATRFSGDRLPPIRQRSPLLLVAPRGALELEQLASTHHLPILEARTVHAEPVTAVLSSLEVDVIVVSCFPWRIPDELIASAPLGGLNLHPSALPAYRGPDPLFWIYRHGRLRTGVTVHQLTAELDAGPIVEQRTFDVPLALPGDRLEELVASIGARLLVRAVDAAYRGRAEARPQPRERGHYFSWPKDDDLVIEPCWKAWRAGHFISGVVPLGYRPVYLDHQGRRTAIRRLLRWCRNEAEALARSGPGSSVLSLVDGALLVEEDPSGRASTH